MRRPHSSDATRRSGRAGRPGPAPARPALRRRARAGDSNRPRSAPHWRGLPLSQPAGPTLPITRQKLATRPRSAAPQRRAPLRRSEALPDRIRASEQLPMTGEIQMHHRCGAFLNDVASAGTICLAFVPFRGCRMQEHSIVHLCPACHFVSGASGGGCVADYEEWTKSTYSTKTTSSAIVGGRWRLDSF
jgi:hypothetical protein